MEEKTSKKRGRPPKNVISKNEIISEIKDNIPIAGNFSPVTKQKPPEQEKTMRYFYCVYMFIEMNVMRYGSTFIETHFDRHVSIGDVMKTVGRHDIMITNVIEFRDKKEWLEFQGRSTVRFEIEVFDV